MNRSDELQHLQDLLVEHVFGSGNPTASLLNHGKFPPNWTSTHLHLIKRVCAAWRDDAMWPREVVTCVHFASVYLELRYLAWVKMTGSHNPSTENQLCAIRTPSERILLAGANSISIEAPSGSSP